MMRIKNRQPTGRRIIAVFAAVTAAWFAASVAPAAAADAAFQKWLADLWPQAQALGVSRQTFDAATRGVEPDLTLPDLDLPGPRGRATARTGRVRADARRLHQGGDDRAAWRGRRKNSPPTIARTLAAIEQQFGVPPNVLLAIWGRETDFGSYKLPKNGITVLATQAYYGRRKDIFRQEFLYALKMLEEGHVKLADMRSSWGGAMGMTQFLPSEFYKYAVDFDGDGKKDIWTLDARCARLRRAATGRQGLAARHALGL